MSVEVDLPVVPCWGCGQELKQFPWNREVWLMTCDNIACALDRQPQAKRYIVYDSDGHGGLGSPQASAWLENGCSRVLRLKKEGWQWVKKVT